MGKNGKIMTLGRQKHLAINSFRTLFSLRTFFLLPSDDWEEIVGLSDITIWAWRVAEVGILVFWRCSEDVFFKVSLMNLFAMSDVRGHWGTQHRWWKTSMFLSIILLKEKSPTTSMKPAAYAHCRYFVLCAVISSFLAAGQNTHTEHAQKI